MRNRELRNRLLETLSETPLVNYACKKVGISRMTFYRWRKDNVDFRKEADRILALGRENIVEMAEAALIKNIKDGKMDAIRFFLQNNDSRYMAKRTLYVEPPPPKKNFKSGDYCEECGEMKPFPKSFDTMKRDWAHFSNEEYTRKEYEAYLREFDKQHFHDTRPKYKRKTGFVIPVKSAYEKDDDEPTN